MKKIIFGTIFLFNSAIFAQVDTLKVSPEYQESSFQGQPETQVKLFTLDINNVYGTWKTKKDIWSFLPNKIFKLYDGNGKILLNGFWDLDNNYINNYDDDHNFLGNLLVTRTEKNIMYMYVDGKEGHLQRVNNANGGVSTKSVTTATKPKRKVNSPLPIMEKNIVGKWQGTNGTIFLFTYRGYLKISPRNERMIDCHWGLDNGYIVMEALGQILMKPQVISISNTKMILAMESGDLHLTRL
jgi:hypothetical protein